MNTIPSQHPKKQDRDKERDLPRGNQDGTAPNGNELNITDGGEFLDDGIRMKDQPFEETTVKENE